MRVSVIIPALNESATVAAAVASSWAAGADQVVVVDGTSHDDTAARASAASQVLVTKPGRGCQQNVGARAADGDWLLFLHADNRLAVHCIAQLRTAAANSSILYGAFRQRIEADGVWYRWLEDGNAARVRWLGLPYGDQAIFLRRAVFEQTGGFLEIQLMEDYVLMRRLRRQSWPALLPGPVFVSPRRWQSNGIVRQTLKNWTLITAYRLGISPERLARHYYAKRIVIPEEPATPASPIKKESLG